MATLQFPDVQGTYRKVSQKDFYHIDPALLERIVRDKIRIYTAIYDHGELRFRDEIPHPTGLGFLGGPYFIKSLTEKYTEDEMAIYIPASLYAEFIATKHVPFTPPTFQKNTRRQRRRRTRRQLAKKERRSKK